MPWETGEEMRLLSIDWGAISDPPFVQGNRMVIPSSDIEFGADNFVLAGILVNVLESNYIFTHLGSGCPWTMAIYQILAGEALASWARERGLHPCTDLTLYQVGDDMHIMVRAKYLADLLGYLGPWCKAKGMKQTKEGYDRVFVTGKNVVWLAEDDVMIFNSFKIIKTQSSAKQSAADFPATVELGATMHIEAAEDAQEQVRQYRELYPEEFFFRGSPEAFLAYRTSPKALQALVDHPEDVRSYWEGDAAEDALEALEELAMSTTPRSVSAEVADTDDAESETVAEAPPVEEVPTDTEVPQPGAEQTVPTPERAVKWLVGMPTTGKTTYV